MGVHRVNERDHQPGVPGVAMLPERQTMADATAWTDPGQLARFRRWQERTFHVDPRKVVWTRRYSAFLAVALVALVIGAVYLAIRTSESLGSALPFLLILWVAWRYASFALSGPPPAGPPKLPSELRLCSVCGNILRVRQLEYGWTAICPACDFRLPLED
jgi:hypothetical protein